MARLYSDITSVSTQGSREERTIGRGSRNRIKTHVRGWEIGVEVVAHVNSEGLDEFHVYRTGGTNGSRRVLLAAFADENSAGPRDRSGRLK